MAECHTCKAKLDGSWKLSEAFRNAKEGRYLGITNGFFMYSEPDWVYCYCRKCYEDAVVQQALQYKGGNVLASQITNLHKTITTLSNEVTTLLQRKEDIKASTDGLLQQKTLLKQEIEALASKKIALEADIKQRSPQIEALSSSGSNMLHDILAEIPEEDAQVLKDGGFNRSTFLPQVTEHLKSAANTITLSTIAAILTIIDNKKNDISKAIEDNEKIAQSMEAMLRNANMPEAVVAKSSEEVRNLIAHQTRQVVKWQAYSDKIKATGEQHGGGAEKLETHDFTSLEAKVLVECLSGSSNVEINDEPKNDK